MPRRIAILFLMLSTAQIGRVWARAPLASGGAPPCSKQNGVREFHSAVVQDGEVSAQIVGIARQDASGCHKSAALEIDNAGVTKTFSLPADAENFELVDFSPDGSQLFLAREASEAVQIAAM